MCDIEAAHNLRGAIILTAVADVKIFQALELIGVWQQQQIQLSKTYILLVSLSTEAQRVYSPLN